jgi:signal transduction histidine kinase
MSLPVLSLKTALRVFIVIVVFVLALAGWWVVFMAQLTDEKVDMAQELGASPEYMQELQEQEVSRQQMLGSEGVVFLVLVLVGVMLIYRTLVQGERFRRHQENFLMAVTHELKTPLASIGIYLDTMQSPKISEEKKLAIIPRMKLDLMRLERLVEDILEAGRFDAALFKPDRQRVNLSKLLELTGMELQMHHPATQIRLEQEIEPELFVSADSAVIKRALAAVFDNAIKYSGGTAANITVALQSNNGQAEIVITDKGIGMEAKELGPIFDRFYRIGNELIRASGGTGLGLYLCREMIRAHDGEVIARSEGLGHGTAIVITLALEK